MNLCVFLLTNYIIIMFYVIFQNLGHGRIRQHVNPSSFSVCFFTLPIQMFSDFRIFYPYSLEIR